MNNNKPIWIINKKVYNLETFLNKHPGGDYILRKNENRDCTELFYSYHILSSKNIEEIMKKYYIREAEDTEITSIFNWSNPVIFNDYKKKLQNHFKNKNYKATNFTWFNYFVLFIANLICYYYWFNGYWLSLPFVSIFGLYLSGEILHSSTHYAISKIPLVNDLISILGIYHSLPMHWMNQHVIEHHINTNIIKKDPDYNHYKNISNLKLKWCAKYLLIKPLYNYFIPLMMTMTFYPNMLRSFIILTHKKNVKFLTNFEFITYIIQLSFIIIIPIYMIFNFGFFKGLCFTFIPRILYTLIFYFVSQVSHITCDAFNYTQLKNNTNNEWIVHQITTSIEYNPKSKFINYLVTGLNNQITHHLCPNIHPIHYPEINYILVDICNKYNIPYTCYDNYWTALIKHFQFIGIIRK